MASMKHSELVEGLTAQQRAAVMHTEGPLLILAGAGSGKTRTVTRRIARLVGDGVDPGTILAITFTNKAAGEMRERVHQLLGTTADLQRKRKRGERTPGPLIATFHAFAVRLLRQYGDKRGWPLRFAILSGAEQLGLIREAAVSARIDLKRVKVSDLAHGIGRAKELLDDEAARTQAISELDRAAAAVLPHYRKLQQARGALDFEDLVAESVHLLEQDEAVRAKVHDQLHYILVDEYQDTNHSQYRLTRILGAARRNVAVCGDPDQSIYGWRGADMGNILRFENDFSGAKVVLLEHNYRSTATILQASNHLIQHNAERKDKQLLPTGEVGEPIEVVACLDAEREAEFVAKAAMEAINEGMPPSEIAVVFRSAVGARAYEDALIQRGVRCAMAGGTSFCERAAIKDALAWIRLALNPRDDLACLRALGKIPGVGKRTRDRLHEVQRAEGCALLEACRSAESIAGLTAPTRERLAGFAGRVARLAESAKTSVESLVIGAMDELGESLDEPEGFSALAMGEDAERRQEDLRRLLEAARAADASARGPIPVSAEARARRFLDRLSLLDAQDKGGDDRDAVLLTTVHASKGLEFRVVFCVGLEEGLFPHRRSLAEGGEEEERRLAYVAFTRAKQRLVLCYANQRTQRGTSEERCPSRFLYELPQDLLWDPILREPMVLPERGQRAIAARREAGREPDPSKAPRTPRLAGRGLRRGKVTPGAGKSKPGSEGKPAGKSPLWARGLVRKR
ncbi:MAG TPA: ATP-dependent DNA helicase PcrA [Planctomycetes bacterium]|nr:ATP-dependent DNA helicase PcrA [Planctomycetota bacterium]